ncbi:MAG: hypothetical protein BWY70_01235 [Bacteroidetes bacterium ADurb.Bin408]|nr:MAG: hypothetical protein BWY70_01235 [Bacteroidetes bacterium ADurb.Bin408]
MKRIIATSMLLFVFTLFVTTATYAQDKAQEPVKNEQIKHNCAGHASDAAPVKSCAGHADTKACCAGQANAKGCCKGATEKKCPATCPHHKSMEMDKSKAVNSNEKKTDSPVK